MLIYVKMPTIVGILTWILCKNQKIPIGVRHATSGIFLILCVWSRYDPQTSKQALKFQNDIWLPW